MGLWPMTSPYPQPFMFIDAPKVRIEGVKVPNDRRYLQAMIQVHALPLPALYERAVHRQVSHFVDSICQTLHGRADLLHKGFRHASHVGVGRGVQGKDVSRVVATGAAASGMPEEEGRGKRRGGSLAGAVLQARARASGSGSGGRRYKGWGR